jgi:hypothetical protein
VDHAVWIQGQASIEAEILELLSQQRGFRIPSILSWSPALDRDRFVRRNFGLSKIAGVLSQDGYPISPFQGHSRADICYSITRGNVATPRFLSSQGPVERELAATAMHRFEFLICYGDSAWNFVHFWNEAYRHGFPGSQLGNRVEAAWVPDEMASDELVKPIISLVEARIEHVPNTYPLRVTIVTYDHTRAQAQALAQLIEKGAGDRVISEIVVCEPGSFPGGLIVGHRRTRPELPQHDQVRGPEFFISPAQRPTATGNEQVWVADFRIESMDEEYLVKGWWTLPRRSNLAELIQEATPARIKEGGNLSVEVSTRTQKIRISLPDDRDLFRVLLRPAIRYSTTLDLRYPLAQYQPETFISSSDKGKYAEGVLGLFQSLSQAGYIFEHPFWRQFFTAYSSPRESNQALTKLRKDIAKSAHDFVEQYAGQREDACSWLAEKMVRSLRNISQIRDAFTYESLTEKWRAYLDTLDPNARMIAEVDPIKDTLTDLSDRGVVMMGSEVRCEHCGSMFWYHIDDLKAAFPCQGCRKEVKLPIELPWSYRLNDLLRTAVREHGTVPLLRTCYRLMRDATTFFRLLTGVELHETRVDDTELIGELDVCYVSDGKFGIAEVKTSARDFTPGDCEKIIKLAKRIGPDCVLIAATEGPDINVESARTSIEQQLDGTVEVRAFVPSSFKL